MNFFNLCPLIFNQTLLPAMLAWHVIFNKIQYTAREGKKLMNTCMGGQIFAEMNKMYIMKNIPHYVYYWVKVPYAQYFRVPT